MFNIFKSKSEIEKLQIKYKSLLKEAHALSTIDRKKSDKKVFEANEILIKMEKLS